MITIFVADYRNPAHAQAIIDLLDEYACSPEGGKKPLGDFVKQQLVSRLDTIANAFSVLAFDDDVPAGLINCFQTLSTFKCMPLINIHDVITSSRYQRQGIATAMLKKVEQVGRNRGCCKLTLEVLQNNAPAREAYRKFGFKGYELDPEMGKAEFWEKPLD